jgi:hypothetical protein
MPFLEKQLPSLPQRRAVGEFMQSALIRRNSIPELNPFPSLVKEGAYSLLEKEGLYDLL